MASILPEYPHVAATINDFSEVISAVSSSVVGYVVECERGSVFKRLNIPTSTARDLYLGKPNLRYGYGLHCLTAGLVTSNTNTVVRVVDKDTAKFGGLKFGANSYTATQYSMTEVFGSPIDTYRDNPFVADPFLGDENSILVIRAENPNEVDYRVRVYDYTQTPASNVATSIMATRASVEQPYTVKVESREPTGLSIGDKVIMSVVVSDGVSDSAYNGTWTVLSVSAPYNYGTITTPVQLPADALIAYNTINMPDISETTSGKCAAYAIQAGSTETDPYAYYGVAKTLAGRVVLGWFHENAGGDDWVIDESIYDSATGWIDSPIVDTENGFIIKALGHELSGNFVGINCTGVTGWAFVDASWKQAFENPEISFTFEMPADSKLLSEHPNSGRWVKYPEFSAQSFGIDVYEMVNGVAIKIESFTDLTMYPATNALNDNTFVEEVVNGRSNTIRVMVKKTGEEGAYEYPTSNPVFTDIIALPKGSCGKRVSAETIAQGWQLFKDPTQSTVNILVNCGYVSTNDMTVQNAMLDIAAKRRDCFCIFDAPKTELEVSPDPKLIDWRRNIQGLNSYDFAQYSNWVKVTDTFTGSRNVWVPMSGFAAQVFSRNDVSRGIAAAPAGMDVGQLAGSELIVTGLSNLYDEQSQESLYKNQVNYAKLVPGSGYYLWGNKTGQTRDSALSMIGAVRVVKQIETALKLAQEYNLFKQNTPFLRLQIEQTIDDYLGTFVTGGQIAAGSCICNDTNNPAEVVNQRQLNIWVFITPLYSAEKIYLQTNVLKSGQSINSVISAIPL